MASTLKFTVAPAHTAWLAGGVVMTMGAGTTVSVTVADALFVTPSCARYVNESVPKKPTFGV